VSIFSSEGQRLGGWALGRLEYIINGTGTRIENGGLQNRSSGYTVETERLQEKAGTAKEKLDGHHHMRSEGNGHELGRTGDRQSRMAPTCGPRHQAGCKTN